MFQQLVDRLIVTGSIRRIGVEVSRHDEHFIGIQYSRRASIILQPTAGLI